MNHYFITGFPGFIASQLIRQLVSINTKPIQFSCLIQLSMEPIAKNEIENIIRETGISPEAIQLYYGDITKNDLHLSIDDSHYLIQNITHVYHLAAIYDLAVEKEIAQLVNVVGTQNVNDFVIQCKKLKRYTYFSTAYVSGNREGKILETELQMGQFFKNHYEKTKYEAEIVVENLKKNVPVTIIRPGIVRGNSKTGATIKFDGPYFLLNMFDKIGKLPIVPYLGKGDAEGNFVPVDYIIQATTYLSHSEKGIGKTYHLTDPAPLTMRSIYKIVLEHYHNKKPLGILPLSIAKFGLSFSFLRKALMVEKEALDYFTCYASYDCSQAVKDLEHSGISCLSFNETLDSMITFYKENKNNKHLHIQIK